jgi:hypothetical protein
MRSHYRRAAFRPRRGAHPDTGGCVIVRPPAGGQDSYFGFCEHLGLWRIVAPPVDAHGTIDPTPPLDGFYAALAAAVEELRAARPDLAEAFERLIAGGDEG